MARKGACCPKEGLKRGAWTSQEDKLLSDYISVHGLGRWRTLPANAGLNRCGKSCRLRWLNYLRPHIKRGNITEEEEELIIRLHKLLGNRWSLIAGRLPGRTDNEIKNYWNTHLRRKLSGCASKRQSSSKIKAVSSEKPTAGEKSEKSVVNVIRTKAARCTRTIFTDQLPNPAADDIPPKSVPEPFSDLGEHNANIGEDQLPNPAADDIPPKSVPEPFSDLGGHNANIGEDEPWMAELLQIPQLTKDSPNDTSSGSLHNVGATDVTFHEDQYAGEWFGGGMKGGEGLYSFLDPDTWECP